MWVGVLLAAVTAFQVVALAWIAAWQQRAAKVVRAVNGQVDELHRVTSKLATQLAPEPDADVPAGQP